VRTKALWLSEGITDYYADIACWRSGLWNDGKFLQTMQGEIQRLQSTPKRLVESVETASWNAFDRGYASLQGDENVDYYNKGKLIGLCLDLTIRHHTQGERSLDDVMRGLYEKYALPKPGFDDDALAAEFSTLAGFDLKPFFASYISGVAELPFSETLMTIGIRCTPGEMDRKAAMRWWQRSDLVIDRGELVVNKPYKSLRQMGLLEGDRVVAVNDKALPQCTDPKELIPALVPEGAGAASLSVKRGESVVSVLISVPPSKRWDIEQLPNPTPTQRKRFEEYRADRYSALVPNGPTLETIGVPLKK
jgi:predicted metalloprotease with PDZ domain